MVAGFYDHLTGDFMCTNSIKECEVDCRVWNDERPQEEEAESLPHRDPYIMPLHDKVFLFVKGCKP